jgi:GTP cyclohydrolase IA
MSENTHRELDSWDHIRDNGDSPLERHIDVPLAMDAVRMLLKALGEDPDQEPYVETPRRVIGAFSEFLTPREFNPTSFPHRKQSRQLVMATDIPFRSLCQHHLLPFSGVAQVAYIPGTRIIGLSKLGRAVEFFSSRLQLQEHLTRQIAEWMDHILQPKGVGVVIDAEHTCVTLRGGRSTGARTVTATLTGVIRSDPATRDNLLAFSRSRPHRSNGDGRHAFAVPAH